MLPTVNDADGTSLTIPVGTEKGGMDRGAAEENMKIMKQLMMK